MKKFTAAVIQMDSGNDVDQNLKELERFIEEAAEKNAFSGRKLMTNVIFFK